MRPAALQAAVYLTVAACSFARGAHAAIAPPAPPTIAGNPRAAVWKAQRVEFFYVGRTSRYSCDGLRDKVRAMLIDLGVRRDLTVAVIGCPGYDHVSGAAMGLRLKIEFSSPALPAAGARPLHEGDLAAVDARFQSFRIESDAFRNMGIGDCELVQQFAQQLLSKLTVRDVHQDIVCVPYQPDASRFLVRGEILKPLPAAEERALRPGTAR
ncbi:MAG TPA: hypothetical protein VK715_08760 [Steroidobacteraceae bacterium]|jgi:hypothetical protein|nr:hypothetical protein [Steroidobacteraceae bacterium]